MADSDHTRRDELFTRIDVQEANYVLAGEHFELLVAVDPARLLDELIERGSAADVADERLPYWAEVWPAALALAEHLLTTPGVAAGADALEIGCGLGLAGIAAGRAGAEVLMTDYQPDALALASCNWERNCCSPPRTQLMDWRAPDVSRQFELIIAADVCYEARFFAPLADLFEALLTPTGRVLIGEPQRAVAGEFFLLLRQRGWQLTRWPRIVQPLTGPEVAVTVVEITR
jgi:predicted nicotinamide N-methyase